MKKRLLTLSLFTTLLLVGCGGGETPSSSSKNDSFYSSEDITSIENNSSESFSSENSSLQEVSSENSSEIESSDFESSSASFSEEISSEDNSISNEVLFETISKAIANRGMIKNGTLRYLNGTAETNISYEFGEDDYGDFCKYTYDSYDEIYGYNADGDAYGLINSNGEYASLAKYSADNIYGPNVNPYIGNENNYGAEGLMNLLLTAIQENKNLDFINNSNSKQYSFSVGRVISNGFFPSLFTTDVTFEVNDDVFTKVEVKIEKYNDIVADFEFDGVYYINDGASSAKTFEITYNQIKGERTLTNDINIEDFYFDQFSLVDADNNEITSSFSATVGVDKTLSISDYLPNTASKKIDSLTFEVVEGDLNYTYSYTNGNLNFIFKTVGNFKVKISSKNYSLNLDLLVKNVVPESVSLVYYVTKGNSYNSYSISKEQSSFDIYRNSTIYLSGGFTPYNASQDYTLELVEENENISIEKTSIKINDIIDSYKEVYKISSSVIGEYDIKITSVEYPEVYKILTINVVEEPALQSLLAKRYVALQRGVINVDVKFTPNETDEKTGSVYISDLYGSVGTYTYSYNEETRSFTLNSSSLSLYFDDTFTLIYKNNSATYTLMECNTINMLKNCEWSGRNSSGITILITFDGEEQKGTITISKIVNYVSQYSSSYEFTYETKENSDGSITITIDEETINEILENEKISSFEKELVISASYSRITVKANIENKDVQIDCTRSY